jgi:nitric oxide reductase NorD protein
MVLSRFPFMHGDYQWLCQRSPLKSGEVFWLGESPTNSVQDIADDSDEALFAPREAFSKGSEIEGKTKDRAQRMDVKDQNENPLTHVFEKVMTAEDYQSGQRKMDGSDEITEHGEALKELTLSHVIRTQQSSDSVFKSNSIIEVAERASEGETENGGVKIFPYPEWFDRTRQYRPNWCHLFERTLESSKSSLAYDRKTAHHLRARIESYFSRYEWLRGQRDGSELDLSAVIDRCAQMRAGSSSTENVYLDRQPMNHDFAIQVLVDSSLSTDSYSQGRRIIETIQEALNIFADAFCDIHDAISIAAFSSQTRHQVYFKMLKDFSDDWSGVAERIAAMTPEGYTRIGPALRHARSRLESTKARRKLVLLLSDGKPTDYDHYEGTHGLSDIRRAVGELHSAGCAVKVLTLSDRKQSHHGFAFGAQNCVLLKNVKDLSESLFHFWHQSIR